MTNNNLEISQKSNINQNEIQEWIISYLANLLEIKIEKIELTVPFAHYKLDSYAVVGLASDLQDWLNIELEPTLIYEYPTIEALTSYLTEELNIS